MGPARLREAAGCPTTADVLIRRREQAAAAEVILSAAAGAVSEVQAPDTAWVPPDWVKLPLP